MARRAASRSTRSRRGVRGGTPRSALCGEAHLLGGDLDAGAAPVRGDVQRGDRDGQHRHDRDQRGRARVAGDGRRTVARSGRARGSWRSATIDEHRMHDYAMSAARVRRRGPTGVASRRPERDEPPARAGDASSTDVHVRAALARRAAPAAARQGVRRDRPTRQRLGTCCARSTTSSCTGPTSGALVDEVAELRQTLAAPTPDGAAGGPPLSPAELRLLPYLQTHLTVPRDRRSAVRLPQHRPVAGRLDLPQARRLVAERRGATGDGDRTARRVDRTAPAPTAPTPRRCRSRAPSPGSVRRRPRQGSPTMATTPISTSTISAALAPASTAASAWAP